MPISKIVLVFANELIMYKSNLKIKGKRVSKKQSFGIRELKMRLSISRFFEFTYDCH